MKNTGARVENRHSVPNLSVKVKKVKVTRAENMAKMIFFRRRTRTVFEPFCSIQRN